MEIRENYFLVSGASSGIGRDLVETLLNEGASVIGFDIQAATLVTQTLITQNC